ncbi:hypothetical protein F511_23860 [Dorcoceras hygrometricum]|uniref:Uncharacterized protein n=1 Tax=Dorcoceras hygrometricum TaxID=472368 RepID=A0A2Z7CXK0_9LAMI|nr:hypothetical protein F511_23860 [Dorcoceras hygrometricum]
MTRRFIYEDQWLFSSSVWASENDSFKMQSALKIKEVKEHEWYYANLPKKSATEKGKAPLEEADPVKGNPAREMVELICADVNFLVQMRDQVMHDVVEFFHYFRINKLSDLASSRALAEKESLCCFGPKQIHWKPLSGDACQPWTAMASQIIDLLSAAHSKSLEELKAQQQEHGIIMDRPSSSQLFKDFADSSGAVLAQFYSLAKSICLHDSFPSFQEAETEPSVHRESSSVSSVLVSDPNAQVDMVQRPDSQIPTVDSPMRFNFDDLSLDDTADNRFSLPAVTTELSASLDALRTFLSQCLDTQTKDIRQIDDSQNDVLSKINTIEKGLRDTLRQLEETFRNLIQSAQKDGRTLDDVQTLRFNEFRKGVLAHSASVTADLMDVRNEVKGLNANVTYLDEQDATIRISHTVAAVVHLWSLGVLTAAGCGIGSVHAVNNELLQLQSIISSEQKFRKPFKRALAADLLVILISIGPSSHSSTSQGSTRRFDLTTRVQIQSHNQKL